MLIPESYRNRVKRRSKLRLCMGFVVRLRTWLKFYAIRKIAVLHGAKVGNNVNMSLRLAMKANCNLEIGSDVVIETSEIDLRDKVVIKDHVIINKHVSITRLSHFIDDNHEFTTRHYRPLVIESYSWLATGCHVLPSVDLIAKGSVIGAYSVLTKNTTEMDVVAGNPAKVIRKHSTLFEDLVVCSLQGGDLMYYIKSMK